MSDIQLATSEAHIKLVAFTLGKEEFGIPIENVREIIRKPEITPLPNAPECMQGVINLRDTIIPILSLKKRFSMPTEIGAEGKIIIAEHADVVMGIEVNDVNEVLDLANSQISETPPMSSTIDSDFISGVGKLGDRLLVVLNPVALLEDHRMNICEEADSSQGV